MRKIVAGFILGAVAFTAALSIGQTYTRSRLGVQDLRYGAPFVRTFASGNTMGLDGLTPINVLAFGVDNTGATACGDSLQAAIDSALAWGSDYVMVPPGDYMIDRTIVIDHESGYGEFVLDLSGAVFFADAGLDSAVFQIGDGANSASNVTIRGGVIQSSVEDALDWGGTIGILVGPAYRCRVYDTVIRNLEYGLKVVAPTGKASVYNTFSLRSIYDCKRPIYLTQTGTGWSNDNHFYDTTIHYGTAVSDSNLSASSAIYMKPEAGASTVTENNVFNGISIENGSGAADSDLPDAIAGAFYDCIFVGCRVEGFDGSGGTLDPYNIDATSEGNQFLHGTGLDTRYFANPQVATAVFQRKRNIMRGEYGAHTAGGPVLELYSRGNYDHQPLFSVIEAPTDTAFMALPTGIYMKPKSSPPIAPRLGQFYVDSEDKKLNMYTGSEWENWDYKRTVVAANATDTLDVATDFALVHNIAGNIILDLPETAGLQIGKTITVFKTDATAGDTVRVRGFGNTETINGVSATARYLTTQYDRITVTYISAGAWAIVDGRFGGTAY